jgi:hypothetical protein
MQSYYRERYLATPIYKWLNGFYEQAEQTAHGAHAVVTASGNADAASTHQKVSTHSVFCLYPTPESSFGTVRLCRAGANGGRREKD